MRKRSKYRPKGVLINPVGYVLEGLTLVRSHDSFMLDLKIKNHDAMTALTQGRATRQDMDTLVDMVNVTEALYRLGFGKEYEEVLAAGLASLLAVGRRGVKTLRFILNSQEMKAINEVMELHDAQMEVITIKDMERAIDIINKEYDQKKTWTFVEKAA